MEVINHIKDALYNLASYKLRSTLAVIGILVGTASVVAMVMCAQLATAKALAQFKPLGTNLMSLDLFPAERKADATNDLTQETVAAMKDLHPDILNIAPYISFHKTTHFGQVEVKGQLLGTTASLADIIHLSLTHGRFISDFDKHARYMVIGAGIASYLKKAGYFNVIGEQMHVGDEYYTIIGVLEERRNSGFFYQDINKAMVVPLQTALLANQQKQIRHVLFNLKEGADFQRLEMMIKSYIQQFSTNLKIYIHSAEEIVEQMTAQSKIFTVLLGLIGGISLLVGGIGVMNIMLVSVTERRQEIGIRKAIGARIHDIVALFLTESMIISFLGGLFGVLLGLLISVFIAQYAQWHFIFYWTPPMIGFIVSVSIGVFFGFYPAFKAAHLAPIDALRT